MNARYSLLSMAAVSCMGLLVLSGCDGEEDRPAAAASAPAVAAERPQVLAQAVADIKANRAAVAQQNLEAFLKENPKSGSRPEACYLLGQALAAQGQPEEGKKWLDEAVDSAQDRTLKALAMFGRADCNMALQKWNLASRQYHWLETMYRDVKAIPQDELMFKLGMACKKAGATDTADYWFKQVIELYATGAFAAQAKQECTQVTPVEPSAKPRVFSLEVASYSKRQKAESEAELLRSKGYRDVQVIETSSNGLPSYEVHIGKYANHNDAKRAQTDAELAGLNTSVRPALIEPLK